MSQQTEWISLNIAAAIKLPRIQLPWRWYDAVIARIQYIDIIATRVALMDMSTRVVARYYANYYCDITFRKFQGPLLKDNWQTTISLHNTVSVNKMLQVYKIKPRFFNQK